ncbi:MAG: neutral/alkaline non-lysosomal ceramidase N-terminal domain-containing protein [Pirellulaceae bacterium]
MIGLLLLAFPFSTAPTVRAAPPLFRAGAATTDLTPQRGVSLDGPIGKNGPVVGIHDPLKSRALVLHQGSVTLAIVVNDMCVIDKGVYDQAKSIVEEKLGIPGSHVLMSATHSHATPRVMRIRTGPLDEAYRELVANRMAEAVIAAHGNLASAKLGFGSFDRRDYVICRRSLCKEGSVGVNPFGEAGEVVKSVAGSSNQVLEPAGPTDPQLSVLSVVHADGKPLALVANFSVHYCGGYERGKVSADYFGAFARSLSERLQSGADHPPFVGMMSNGTSGNISSVQVRVNKKGPWIRIEKSGAVLAEQTAELVTGIQHTVPAQIAALVSHLELSVRKPDAQRVAWAKKFLESPGTKGPHRWSRVYADETLHLAKFPEKYRLFIQVFRIGDVGIASLPCEAFAETGLIIKKNSPFQHAFTISLANGFSGYLPPPQQHKWGGYETWPARSSHLEVGAEPKIVAEISRLMQELAD